MHVLFPSRESVMRNATEVFIYCLLSDSSYRGAIQTINYLSEKEHVFVCDTQTICGSKIRHTVPPKYLRMKETDIHMIKSAAHEPTLKKLSTTNSI